MDKALREEYMRLKTVEEYNDFLRGHPGFLKAASMDQEMKIKFNKIICSEGHDGDDPMCHTELFKK